MSGDLSAHEKTNRTFVPMAKRDYYNVLGVQRGASEQDLKAAFRRLAKEHHPDKNKGDAKSEQQFKEIAEAYEALKDPQKRAAYDQFGHAAFENGGRGGQGGFGPDFANSMSDIFDDLFGEFMGGRGGARGGRQRGGRERGSDLRYNMEVLLAEAYSGKTAQIRRIGCSGLSSACTTLTIFPAPGSAWRSCSGSFAGTMGKSGPKRRKAKEQRSFSM